MNDLQKAFAALKARSIFTFPAEVISVDKESGTCTVDDGEIQYEDVQLSSIVDGKKNQLFVFPLVGSSVLVSPIEEDINWLYVEVYSEVEAVDWKIASGIFFSISPNGITIEALNKPIVINSGNSSVEITDNGVDIQSDKGISLNGGFEALYNLVPGMPITDVSQIGISKKVKIG